MKVLFAAVHESEFDTQPRFAALRKFGHDRRAAEQS
jgi:hypothetical protein